MSSERAWPDSPHRSVLMTAAAMWSCMKRLTTPVGAVRSYYEPALDAVIDNGNHLLLSGNHAALDTSALWDRRRAWWVRIAPNSISPISRAGPAGGFGPT